MLPFGPADRPSTCKNSDTTRCLQRVHSSENGLYNYSFYELKNERFNALGCFPFVRTGGQFHYFAKVSTNLNDRIYVTLFELLQNGPRYSRNASFLQGLKNKSLKLKHFICRLNKPGRPVPINRKHPQPPQLPLLAALYYSLSFVFISTLPCQYPVGV